MQAQLANAFNQFQLTGDVNRTVLTALNSDGYEGFNPFTTTPVRGVHWDTGPEFGNALSGFSYSQPRTFVITFGSRF